MFIKYNIILFSNLPYNLVHEHFSNVILNHEHSIAQMFVNLPNSICLLQTAMWWM